jgi:DNA end-binding protein Ku
MPGAIWKGSINFGLVFIRASVCPATREEKISFKQLRATDLSPIKCKKVVEVDHKEVPADQIGKGYEFERQMGDAERRGLREGEDREHALRS